MATGGKHSEQESSNAFDQLSDDLRKATLHKIELFESIRGKQCSIPFWDVVVITAIDAAQKQAYERQISEKIERKELPLGVKFHVISDPVGPKIGNGGSTLVVAEELETMYKEKAKDLKVLIVHAGGFSQRLPSGSLLGKIFMALPMGNPIYQTLELKLAMYIEFPQRMPPGMFVTSADTIELYVLDGDWTFMNKGFTAMAHPSPIEIGTTHGVFCLDDSSMKTLLNTSQENTSVQNGVCRKFIHKPTREYMHSSGAVFQHNEEDYVYSDSAFFMDYDSVKLMLDWKRSNGSISCEVDAYGDFLQALGPEGTIGYCNNVRNVTLVEPTLVKTRESIFHLLRNSQLNVLMLNKSKFYHMGTTMEYIHHFCEDLSYRYEMTCSNTAMIKSVSSSEDNKLDRSSCILHSYLEGDNTFGHNSVTEYGWLGKASSIGNNSIVSNVFIPDGLALPDDVFMHTVCVTAENEEKAQYVTVTFGIKDNLKKTCSDARSSSELKLHHRSLDKAVELLGYPMSIWSQDCLLLNIWHARLFPAFPDARESLKCACDMMNCLKDGQPLNSKFASSRLYAMADILKEKDIDGIFNMRAEIRKAILS